MKQNVESMESDMNSVVVTSMDVILSKCTLVNGRLAVHRHKVEKVLFDY